MNDVLHHCVRKYAEELKQSLESVAVEMFCAAWTSSGNDNVNPPTERDSIESRQGKLSKLIKLWEDKAIFSPSTLNKMRSSEDSWKTYVQQLKLDYADVINIATNETVKTYDKYASQVIYDNRYFLMDTAIVFFNKILKYFMISKQAIHYITASGICISCAIIDK